MARLIVVLSIFKSFPPSSFHFCLHFPVIFAVFIHTKQTLNKTARVICMQWRVCLHFYFGYFFVESALPWAPRLRKSGAAQQLSCLRCMRGAAACLPRGLRRTRGRLTAQITVRDRLTVTRANIHALTESRRGTSVHESTERSRHLRCKYKHTHDRLGASS